MSRSFIKSCIVGAWVFGVDFAALWLFQHFLPRLLAVSVAYFLAVSLHFCLNKWWVFGAQTKVRATELGRYVLVVLLCWLCTMAVVWLGLSFATSSVFVAKLLAIPPTTILGFVLMRRFVFR